MKYLKINNIKLNIDSTNQDAISEAIKIANIPINDVYESEILKMSIDARKKPDLKKIYSVGLLVENYFKKNKNIQILDEAPKYKYEITGEGKLNNRPIVVGFGPAGLFASYLLAMNGYKPIIIERGSKVDEREEKVNKFWNDNVLDTECNVQFGEGGAGTFSDGKLNTGNKDKLNRIKFILDTFVEFGANENIKYDSKPHMGTDILKKVIKNMREKIITYGGEFLFDTKVIDITYDENVKIQTTNGNFVSDVCILAIGNSARDTFEMLYKNGFELEAKPFAVGLRIEHKQSMINKSQYGIEYPSIGPATYKLTYHSLSGRSVYSFCMCPGGYVVNASSEENRLVVNGMSYNKRDSENANSAIVVSVTPDDFENENPLSGIKFQRALEDNAYKEGDGKIPIQKLIDFMNDIDTNSLGEISPIMKSEYKFANLNKILPQYISEPLKEGIEHFGEIIEGFSSDDAILSAVESRTSSPVRIIRNEDLHSNFKSIYPAGEGAGYAGGIISSAVDGMRVFEKIIAEYKPLS